MSAGNPYEEPKGPTWKQDDETREIQIKIQKDYEFLNAIRRLAEKLPHVHNGQCIKCDLLILIKKREGKLNEPINYQHFQTL